MMRECRHTEQADDEFFTRASSETVTTRDEVAARPDAVFLDVRADGEIKEASLQRNFVRCEVTIDSKGVCDASNLQLRAAELLGERREVPIIVFGQREGKRAAKAKATLEELGYKCVINGGGLADVARLRDESASPATFASLLHKCTDDEINAQTTGECVSALHIAAQDGNMIALNHLLNHPRVKPEPQDKKERTPIFFAAQNGHVQAVKLLLRTARKEGEASATRVANACMKDGRTPLMIAAMVGLAYSSRVGARARARVGVGVGARARARARGLGLEA